MCKGLEQEIWKSLQSWNRKDRSGNGDMEKCFCMTLSITWASCLIRAKISQLEIDYYTTAVIKLVGQNHPRAQTLRCLALCKFAWLWTSSKIVSELGTPIKVCIWKCWCCRIFLCEYLSHRKAKPKLHWVGFSKKNSADWIPLQTGQSLVKSSSSHL